MPVSDANPLIADFGQLATAAAGKGGLSPVGWGKEQWRHLFECADLRVIRAGDALIRRGDPERTLYFVLRGALEVIVHSGHGISLGALTKAMPGTVLGEVSFFDGQPRSASVWALKDSDVAAMTLDQFQQFESQHPQLARDLLFALGQVLAARLRSTNSQLNTSG